ncbi:urease accessory protein UreD [Phytomonospora sp. NPDC050363]|uniref:urease accessory protein UreD n=1 Tax=Phytomonospora sp. NPDC050363 TaxID=3155642 RepID=UPI0033DF21F0
MPPLGGLPELAAYQDEPAQMPSGAPGKNGYLRLGFARRGERTELADLDRRTPLLAQQALHFDEGMPELACVFMVSTSGGILQGDRYEVDVTVGADARAHITSQSATKLQEMDANFATMSQTVTVADGGYLEFLPEPIIPYRHSRYAARTRLEVAESATALYADVLLPGRKHYGDGEIFAYDVYSSHVVGARPDGGELFTEKIVIEPNLWSPGRSGVMGGFHVLGTVILMTPADVTERMLPLIPVGYLGGSGDDRVATGVSRLPRDAGLIYKILGMESEPVRAAVRDFWTLTRREVMNEPVPDRFRWR